MLYKKFGRTDIDVSSIGFGGMRFENIKDQDKCASLVKDAYEKGINYFDTAPLYFGGQSESAYGKAFAEMKKTREEKPFYVSTKTFKSTDYEIREDLEYSLKRLQVDYIDFYHVWCLIRLDAYKKRVKNGVLDTFVKLKEEGLIKHICFSSHMNGKDTAEVLKDYPFDGVLLGYSAMNFAYREEALKAAAQANCAVVVMNPLGGGIIPQNPELFSFLKNKEDETVVEAAIRFLMNDSRITLPLIGFSNTKELDEAISGVDGFKPIPQERLEEKKANIPEIFNELCTSCCYCDKCPQKIAVPKLMDAYNHLALTKNRKTMIDRLKWHWQILNEHNIDACVECGLCEKECTQKLPIIERLKEIHKIIKSGG